MTPTSRAAWALFVLMAVIASLTVPACSPRHTQTVTIQPHVKKLLVLPFKNSTRQAGKGNLIRCVLCGTVYTTGTVAPGAEDFMTRHLTAIVDDWGGVTRIPVEEYQELRDRFVASHAGQFSEKEILAAVGRDLGADAILIGSIYRFSDRVGGEYAAETPASVGFDLDLFGVQAGRVLWSRKHEETQEALLENLFGIGAFFKRKGKWLTVEDLAAAGLHQALETIPLSKGKN